MAMQGREFVSGIARRAGWEGRYQDFRWWVASHRNAVPEESFVVGQLRADVQHRWVRVLGASASAAADDSAPELDLAVYRRRRQSKWADEGIDPATAFRAGCVMRT